MSIHNAVCTNAKCRVFLLNYAKLQSVDEPAPQFCPECGSGVLDACPRCHSSLIEGPYPGPNNCHNCGQRLRFDPDSHSGGVTIIVED